MIPNPRLINVDVREDPDDNDGHVEIVLEAITANLAGKGPTDTDLRAAAVDVAGVMARVGLFAMPWIISSQRAHGCQHRPRWSFDADDPFDQPLLADLCHLYTSDQILRPNFEPHLNAGVSLVVPREDVELWLSRIGAWLSEIQNDVRSVADEKQEEAEPGTHVWRDDGSGISCNGCGLARDNAVHHTTLRVAS